MIKSELRAVSNDLEKLSDAVEHHIVIRHGMINKI